MVSLHLAKIRGYFVRAGPLRLVGIGRYFVRAGALPPLPYLVWSRDCRGCGCGLKGVGRRKVKANWKLVVQASINHEQELMLTVVAYGAWFAALILKELLDPASCQLAYCCESVMLLTLLCSALAD